MGEEHDLKEMYKTWDESMLLTELNWLTEEKQSARLRMDVLIAEIAEKEHECKKAQKTLDGLDADYKILVEEISQRNGD